MKKIKVVIFFEGGAIFLFGLVVLIVYIGIPEYLRDNTILAIGLSAMAMGLGIIYFAYSGR